jgi:hypothetical protein
VAGLSSGIVTLARSAKTSAAGAIADKQMEAFRGISFDAIATTSTSTADCIYTGAASGTYTLTSGATKSCTAANPSAYSATQKIDTLSTCSGGVTYCIPTQKDVSGSGGPYRVDTYVYWACPTAVTPPSCTNARAVKQVTVIVRNDADPTKTLFRETSNFDPLGE